MTGRELYAVRQPRHRRTWTVAAIDIDVIVIVGQFGAMLPVITTGWSGVGEISTESVPA